jgi:multidrug efflux pump subunit AcrB
MAIVAVFLPVALMPGIAGQYFKAFGFTVVVSVLMSLLVARMITPLMAAYFLRSRGVQPHANWRWMDMYLKVLNWSLDTSKAHAVRAALPKAEGKIGYWFVGLLPRVRHRRGVRCRHRRAMQGPQPLGRRWRSTLGWA